MSKLKTKVYLIFLIPLSLILIVNVAMAAGDSEPIIYECKVTTKNGDVIEGYVKGSINYGEEPRPPCDKIYVASRFIYRNVYKYDMLPVSKMLDTLKNKNANYKGIYQSLRQNVYVSKKDVIKISMNDIKSSTGFVSKHVDSVTPFNRMPDESMNLLSTEMPFAVFGFGRDDIFKGPVNVLISFDDTYNDYEKLSSFYHEIADKISSELRAKKSEIAEKYRNQTTELYKRYGEDDYGRPLKTEQEIDAAVSVEINRRAEDKLRWQIPQETVKQLEQLNMKKIILIHVILSHG